MRIRKKPNLTPRMERCAHVLIDDPAALKGEWLAKYPQYKSLWLEIGCGKGRFTAETARENPDVLLVAIEKVPDAMVMAMERCTDEEIENVRFIDGDALALPVLFAGDELDRIFINFCDPWPRSNSAKHRLTAPGFLRSYASALKNGGEIHFKTDNDPLFDWSAEQMKGEGWEITELTNDLHANGPCGIMTDYEVKFFEIGKSINRLVARKISDTKSTADGEPPRLHEAGIERPYRTSEVLKG